MERKRDRCPQPDHGARPPHGQRCLEPCGSKLLDKLSRLGEDVDLMFPFDRDRPVKRIVGAKFVQLGPNNSLCVSLETLTPDETNVLTTAGASGDGVECLRLKSQEVASMLQIFEGECVALIRCKLLSRREMQQVRKNQTEIFCRLGRILKVLEQEIQASNVGNSLIIEDCNFVQIGQNNLVTFLGDCDCTANDDFGPVFSCFPVSGSIEAVPRPFGYVSVVLSFQAGLLSINYPTKGVDLSLGEGYSSVSFKLIHQLLFSPTDIDRFINYPAKCIDLSPGEGYSSCSFKLVHQLLFSSTDIARFINYPANGVDLSPGEGYSFGSFKLFHQLCFSPTDIDHFINYPTKGVDLSPGEGYSSGSFKLVHQLLFSPTDIDRFINYPTKGVDLSPGEGYSSGSFKLVDQLLFSPTDIDHFVNYPTKGVDLLPGEGCSSGSFKLVHQLLFSPTDTDCFINYPAKGIDLSPGEGYFSGSFRLVDQLLFSPTDIDHFINYPAKGVDLSPGEGYSSGSFKLVDQLLFSPTDIDRFIRFSDATLFGPSDIGGFFRFDVAASSRAISFIGSFGGELCISYPVKVLDFLLGEGCACGSIKAVDAKLLGGPNDAGQCSAFSVSASSLSVSRRKGGISDPFKVIDFSMNKGYICSSLKVVDEVDGSDGPIEDHDDCTHMEDEVLKASQANRRQIQEIQGCLTRMSTKPPLTVSVHNCQHVQIGMINEIVIGKNCFNPAMTD